MTDRPTLDNWLSILMLGIVWGGTFMVVAVALRGYGPVTVATARTGMGALALYGLLRAIGGTLPRDRVPWMAAAPIGILSTALPFFLLSWGQQYVPSSVAGLTVSALPLFVLPMAHALSDEPMSIHGVLGVAIGFVGTLVLLGPNLSAPVDGGRYFAGQIACLAAILCLAAGSILTRRAPRIDPITLTTMALIAGTSVLLPIMLIAEGVPRPTGGISDLAILFLGLVPTAIAALIRVRVIQSAGSVFMTLVNYQVPIWSMLFGAIVLGETLPWRLVIALALILSGIAVSQWRSIGGLLR